eukprot:CAMPEP_0197568132 /NCGR_PEP_ID=MMETSP1320-20131121/36825_1 /TAXON_ID=91990 /ORGANISM="Bolidomonas sp., Strain RCC2347" /LENGTH=264 /DNA_ID=CAMNT_0043130393 /DNA_START=92 /DNA_END=883 /DNA_ORIENTATION=-
MQTIPRLSSMLLLLFVCPYLPTTLSFLTSPIQRGSVVTSPARSQPSLLRPFFVVSSTSGFRSALFSLGAKSKDPAFRKAILTGPSSYMKVSDSSVSFGATVKLSTALPTSGKAETEAWLRDLDSVAAAIWDPTKVKRLPNAWRLSLISLRFVTIELLPTVDVELLTRDNSAGDAVFYLSSVGFDPRVKILPGVGIKAEDLGIEINVVGQMKAMGDKGVVGAIGFETTGNLPLPLRVLPRQVLEKAGEAINKQIVKFAEGNFKAN